jgi:regulator of sigma E protease
MIETIAITVVSFLGILIVLVFAHEFGHFITAKLAHVKVEEFGIGFPPRIVSFKRGETTYSINSIPLGGFTKMVGEEDPTLPGSLAGKSIPVRILVLSAGSLMNILLPVLLFSISLMIPHNMILEKVQVQEVATGSPAQTAGIVPGDTILSINNHTINNRSDVGYYVQLYLGTQINMVVQSADLPPRDVRLTPRWNPPPGQGATGIKITGVDSTTVRESEPFWRAVPASIVHCWEILVLFRNQVIGWFIGGAAPQVTGPIGIAQITGEIAKAGISPLLEFAALISINLAIINIFPFPGLDGGRLIFVLLEWIRRGKRISPKREGLVHLIGFAVLLLLIIVISYFDIAHIVQGDSILP